MSIRAKTRPVPATRAALLGAGVGFGHSLPGSRAWAGCSPAGAHTDLATDTRIWRAALLKWKFGVRAERLSEMGSMPSVKRIGTRLTWRQLDCDPI